MDARLSLLLIGMKLSNRDATRRASVPSVMARSSISGGLIVAALIFGLGGGICAYEGTLAHTKPQRPLGQYGPKPPPSTIAYTTCAATVTTGVPRP